jgi:hypothetical protein
MGLFFFALYDSEGKQRVDTYIGTVALTVILE